MKSNWIRVVQAWRVRVPLLQEWAASPEFGPHPDGSDRLVVRVEDQDAVVGWGEGELRTSPEEVGRALEKLLGLTLSHLRLPLLDLWTTPNYYHQPLAPSPLRPDESNLVNRLRHPLQAPVEMALLDLLAQRAGVPLCVWCGGPWRERVPVDYWMGRVTPDHARHCVKRARALGFTGVKLKTALEDPNVARLEAIRDAGGPEWKVTVDANGRFHRLDDAMGTLRAMDAVGNMAIIEDPFPRSQLEEFSELRGRLHARVVVHLDPPESLHAVIQQRAAGGLNLDSHTQGLMAWRAQAAAVAQANLSIWHGSGLDLGIATAAQLHLAASAPNCRLPGDQAGPWLRASTLIEETFEVADGMMTIPAGPGIGVHPARDAVEQFTIQSWNFS